MSKITSKYQVTLPKAIAREYDIHPGDEISWVTAGDVIRVIPPGKQSNSPTAEEQLRWFDQATERQRRRKKAPTATPTQTHQDRGWTREDLYPRGRSH